MNRCWSKESRFRPQPQGSGSSQQPPQCSIQRIAGRRTAKSKFSRHARRSLAGGTGIAGVCSPASLRSKLEADWWLWFSCCLCCVCLLCCVLLLSVEQGPRWGANQIGQSTVGLEFGEVGCLARQSAWLATVSFCPPSWQARHRNTRRLRLGNGCRCSNGGSRLRRWGLPRLCEAPSRHGRRRT